jgi:thioredoxin-like negative regulator of GroEL
MGAFLVRFFNAKIKFFYWFFIFFGTFSAPAWLMLPLWFTRELFFAQALDVVVPGGGGGGVAYWAHVWGFVFGAVVAGGIRRFDVEEKFIDRAIESKITVIDNRSIEEALDLRAEGRVDEAFQLLTRAVDQDPGNVDAVTALWNLAVDLHRTDLVAPRLLQLLRKAAMSGNEDLVVAQWGELGRELPQLRLEPGLALKIAEVFHASGDDETAGDVISRLALTSDTEIPAGGAVRLARLAAALGSGKASALASIALSHPDLPHDTRLELASIARIEGPGPTAEDESPGAPAEAPSEGPVEVVDMPRHELQVMQLKPTSLAATGLVLHAGESRRTLAFEHIQAIAVGGIKAGDGKAAHLVVDLLLDPPYGSQNQLRIVRLDGTAYDPRQIVDESDPMTAFRMMIGRLLDASEALPLPDAEAARGQPFRMYGSLADYEKSVLNAS